MNAAAPQSFFRRHLPAAIVVVVLIGIGYAIYSFSTAQQKRTAVGRFGGDQGPVPVLAVAARNADVPVYLDGVGTARALNTVTVIPQVGGKLISVNFREGQDVEKDFVLAKIDPVTYQAQYDMAVAKKAQDEATLANARLDLERYTRLAQTAAGSRQQADTQRAQVAQQEALVSSDQAAIDNAKASLDWTDVRAPIAGRTGIRQVDAGNIVSPSATTGIVVLTQVRPIAVLFNLPQQQLPQVNKAFAAGPLKVDAFDADNRTVLDQGTLQVVDNQVDPTTGTVRLKGEFPNANLQLWPGQFANVRLLIDTLRNVVTVPTAAVQRGPNGTFVYVVQDGKSVVRNVTVAQQDDVRAVITDGLQASDQVVTTGFARLTDGGRVTVTSGEDAAPGAPKGPAGPAAARPQGPKGQRPDGEKKKRTEATPGSTP
jgi:multidrug efflux system membrane fusion protein